MKKILFLIILGTMYSCGPSKADIEAKQRDDLRRDSVDAANRLSGLLASVNAKDYKGAKEIATYIISNYPNTPAGGSAKNILADITAKLNLDKSLYEIVTTQHFPACQNFHVLVKLKKMTPDNLQDFVDKFKGQYCVKNCNIYLYDSKAVKDLMTKYPLSKSEYKTLAKHTIASSMYEIPGLTMNPYKDAFN